MKYFYFFVTLFIYTISFAHGDYSDDFLGIHPGFIAAGIIVGIGIIGILIEVRR
jgi:hypothetical protein